MRLKSEVIIYCFGEKKKKRKMGEDLAKISQKNEPDISGSVRTFIVKADLLKD